MKKKFLFTIALLSTLIIFSGCMNDKVKTTNLTPNQQSFKRFQSVPPEKTIMLQTGEKKYACPECGMKLPMFYKTNHSAISNGKIKQYCSLHCLVDDKVNNKSELKDIRVVAIDTLKFIDAINATYVVGSKKSGTMSTLSKYAFEGRMSAKRFAKENGGKVMKFNEAYGYALRDFK
jgi:hypothetical protein